MMDVLPAIAILGWTFAAGVMLGSWLKGRHARPHHETCAVAGGLLKVVDEIEFDHRVTGAGFMSMRCFRFGARGRIYLARVTRADEPARQLA